MIAELCIDVINSFKELKNCLATVNELVCVQDRHLPAWFQAPAKLGLNPNLSKREQACALLNQLEYLDQQEPREILVGAGIIAASQQTLDATIKLNNAKLAFKAAMLKIKAAKIAPDHEFLSQNFEELLQKRDINLASSMIRMGLARVHLKQCYRVIPFFNVRPRKISWTWANTRAIKKISVQDAFQLLNKNQRDAGIERQMSLLQGIDADETLAIIQDLAPHLRANIVLPEGNSEKRIMVKGPVPIFYLADDNLNLPEFAPPGDKRGKDMERNVRSDVKINPEPFLPAIRAHRYFK
jgi:hypothetical protein